MKTIMDTKQMDKSELRNLICECVDQTVHCPSSPEIESISFRVAQIDHKIDKKLLKIWEVVKEIRAILAPQDGSIE